MGTDIKGFVEVKQWDVWRSFVIIEDMPGSRDYHAFAFLFGMRNIMSVLPVAANRGLPLDISQKTQNSLSSEDLHSRSWVTWHEISESGWQNQKFGAYWWFLMHIMETISEEYESNNVRLVVAFGG